jgi:hypothetical protein
MKIRLMDNERKVISDEEVLAMWYWIGMAAFIYILFIILEESIYLVWNRYVYGPKVRKARLWNNRIILGIAFFIRLQLKEIRQKHTRKASSH